MEDITILDDAQEVSIDAEVHDVPKYGCTDLSHYYLQQSIGLISLK